MGAAAGTDLVEAVGLRKFRMRTAEVAVPSYNTLAGEHQEQEEALLAAEELGQQETYLAQVVVPLLVVEADLGRANLPTEVVHPSMAAYWIVVVVAAVKWKRLLQYQEEAEPMTCHCDPSIPRPWECPKLADHSFVGDPIDW